jgi:glycosyltransferase involved in cell wall biosynthesis
MADETICEIRVPTFRRNTLLRRALRSAQAQTHEFWRCLVFDDCPERSAKPVVDELRDSRIIYRANARPLRAIGNIDQCFRNDPFAGGQFACVLEDDNYLFPQYLANRLQDCASHRVNVTFSAQACESIIVAGEPGELNPGRTLAWIYPQGALSPEQVLPALLFSHAFSNGGVFWRLGCISNFELGPVTTSPGVQETARLMRLRDDVYISHAADSAWRVNDPKESTVNKNPGHRLLERKKARWHQLREHRELVGLREEYLRRYGPAEALRVAATAADDRRAEIERAFLTCGAYVVLTSRPTAWRLRRFVRGWLFRCLVPNGFSWGRGA